MPAFDRLVQVLETLSQQELNNLAVLLLSGEPTKLQEFPKLTAFLQTHSVECISKGNNKIYKVREIGGAEFYIFKLSNPDIYNPLQEKAKEDITQRMATNPVLNAALAPVHWSRACSIHFDINHEKGKEGVPETRLYRYYIQIQPFCNNGTLEKIARATVSPKQRIYECLYYLQQVVDFYVALEQEHILFSDGKLSNFTINNKRLALTDTKCFFDANQENLAKSFALNSPRYFLYIPEHPRLLSQVHSRHLGLILYRFMIGQTDDIFYSLNAAGKVTGLIPTASYGYSYGVFQPYIGRLFAVLIKALISDDPSLRPNVKNVKKVFELIKQLILLEKIIVANPFQGALLAEHLTNVGIHFEVTLQDAASLQDMLNKSKYLVANGANIIKSGKLLDELTSLLSEEKDDSNMAFLGRAMVEKKQLIKDALPFDNLCLKLQYRKANDAHFKQVNVLLRRLTDTFIADPQNMKLQAHLCYMRNWFATLVEQRLPLQELINNLEGVQENEKDFCPKALSQNIHAVFSARPIGTKRPLLPLRMRVKEPENAKSVSDNESLNRQADPQFL